MSDQDAPRIDRERAGGEMSSDRGTSADSDPKPVDGSLEAEVAEVHRLLSERHPRWSAWDSGGDANTLPVIVLTAQEIYLEVDKGSAQAHPGLLRRLAEVMVGAVTGEEPSPMLFDLAKRAATLAKLREAHASKHRPPRRLDLDEAEQEAFKKLARSDEVVRATMEQVQADMDRIVDPGLTKLQDRSAEWQPRDPSVIGSGE